MKRSISDIAGDKILSLIYNYLPGDAEVYIEDVLEDLIDNTKNVKFKR